MALTRSSVESILRDNINTRLEYDKFSPEGQGSYDNTNPQYWRPVGKGYTWVITVILSIFTPNKGHFLKWKFVHLIQISLTSIDIVLIKNTPALIQIMAWHRTGDKSLSEPGSYVCHSASMTKIWQISANECSVTILNKIHLQIQTPQFLYFRNNGWGKGEIYFLSGAVWKCLHVDLVTWSL